MRLIPLTRQVRKAWIQQRREAPRQARDWTRWLALAAVYLLAVLLTSVFLLFKPPVPGSDGRLAVDQVRAWTDFRFVTDRALQEWEARREANYRRVWRYEPLAGQEVQADLQALASYVRNLDVEQMAPDELAARLRARDTRFNLSPERARQVVDFLREPRYVELLDELVSGAYRERLIVDRPAQYIGQVQDGVAETKGLPDRFADRANRVLPLDFDWVDWRGLASQYLANLSSDFAAPRQDIRPPMEAVLSALLRPNVRFDQLETERNLEGFPRGDLSTRFERNERLLQESAIGRELSREEARILQAHRQAVENNHRRRFLGHLAFVAMAFIILSFYVRKFSREVAFSTHNVLLISLPILLGLSVQAFSILLADGQAEDVGLLFPAGAVGMLGVLLLDVRMALLLVTWGCLLFGLQVNLQWDFVVVGLFGGYTAVAAIYTIRKRYEVFVASVLIGLTNAAVILVMAGIQGTDSFPLIDAGLGLIAGLASFLVLAILPVVERFGIITDVQLLELTGLHNPLLRRLEEEAPGTWQHTLNVAKLAEAAATEIGVNYLLIRAGCYYHDIGKVAKPQYFTENQLTAEEKQLHKDLKPIMSAMIIKNHVKEGVEMAKAAGLPPRIIDFITQHHGTSVITYFYHKALEAQARGEDKGTVRVDDFRYPWQKPQSIETAIVMLADSVEATATAKLSNRTVREDDIQQVVRTTIRDKFDDGQFNECNLTLRDLNTIREVFVRVLKSRFHTRIDYPKKPAAKAPKLPKKEEGGDSRPGGATRDDIPKPSNPELPLRAQA